MQLLLAACHDTPQAWFLWRQPLSEYGVDIPGMPLLRTAYRASSYHNKLQAAAVPPTDLKVTVQQLITVMKLQLTLDQNP